MAKPNTALMLGVAIAGVTVIGIAAYLILNRSGGGGAQGQIRLQTAPSSNVRIYVDDNLIDSWGLDWPKFNVGDHVIRLEKDASVPGVLPPPLTITVKAGVTSRVVACLGSGTPDVIDPCCLDTSTCTTGGVWLPVEEFPM